MFLITEQNKKVEEQKANVEEIENAKKQLKEVLQMIEIDTQKRISKIVQLLDKQIHGYYN